jgi:hypothetical protein
MTWLLMPGVYRLTASPEAIAVYLENMDAATARPARSSSMEIAARDRAGTSTSSAMTSTTQFASAALRGRVT